MFWPITISWFGLRDKINIKTPSVEKRFRPGGASVAKPDRGFGDAAGPSLLPIPGINAECRMQNAEYRTEDS